MAEDCLHEIWWKKNIFKTLKPISYPKISIIIYTDGLLEGCGASNGNVSTDGACLSDDKMIHINVLTLKAILLALKSFVKTSDKRIRIMSHNTTAIRFINKMGASQLMANIWQICSI